MESWPPKDPQDVLDYEFDWTDRLEVGETLETSVFTVVQGTVVIDSSAINGGGTLTTVWLSGGGLGERCKVTNHVVTSEGREWDVTALLRIRSSDA